MSLYATINTDAENYVDLCVPLGVRRETLFAAFGATLRSPGQIRMKREFSGVSEAFGAFRIFGYFIV